MNICQRRGLTLIELVISVFIFSIILLILVSVLRTVFHYRVYSDVNEEMQNTYFALDYMQREFRQATKIHPISNFFLSGKADKKYLDFVVVKKMDSAKLSSKGCKYHYSVYYYKNGSIYRNATTKPSELGLEGLHELGGYNLLCNNISSVDGTEYIPELNLIRLRWVFEYRGIRRYVERDFFIRGEGL